MRITWERLIPSLFILTISFLAARYLGTIYYFLFRALAFLFIADLIFLIICHIGLRYNQHFSSEHLIRGESIHYDFYMDQSFFTPASLIHISFFSFYNPEMTDLSPLTFSLKSREKKTFSYTIQGGTRGIYRVGIKSLTMEDYLGFFKIALPRHERTFYIYPRLYHGEGYPLKQVAGGGETLWDKSKDDGDNTFSHLREYRPGLPLNGISWKHFARFGFPILMERENSVQPGRIIHMDRRSLQGNRQQEDGVLETTLSLIHRILNLGESVLLEGILPNKPLEITNESTFDSFYRATLSLSFNDPLPPQYRETAESVTIVSALPNWDLLKESFWQHHSQWQLVAVLEGMEKQRKHRIQRTLEELQRKGVNITIIERGELFWQEK